MAVTSRRGTPVWWRELQALATEMLAAPLTHWSSSIDPSAHVAETAVLDTSRGPIMIGARTRICAGACIQGPVQIGDDCLVGNMSMIRGPARVGSGTRIGFATEVKGAII